MSLALAEGGRRWSRNVNAGRPHDALLCRETEELLRRAGWKPPSLDLIVAASGPGSFTGIRVGMTFVSMLAGVLGRSMRAVTLFEAAASRAAGCPKLPPRSSLVVVLPSARGEWCFQAFRKASGEGVKPWGEPCWTPAAGWPAALRRQARGMPVLLTGPAARRAARELPGRPRLLGVEESAGLGAEDLIAAALIGNAAGSPANFRPLYLKPAYYERRA